MHLSKHSVSTKPDECNHHYFPSPRITSDTFLQDTVDDITGRILGHARGLGQEAAQEAGRRAVTGGHLRRRPSHSRESGLEVETGHRKATASRNTRKEGFYNFLH